MYSNGLADLPRHTPWSAGTKTDLAQGPFRALVSDDGELVVLGKDDHRIWGSKAVKGVMPGTTSINRTKKGIEKTYLVKKSCADDVRHNQ